MKSISVLLICLMSSIICYSQTDSRPVLGVASFTSEVNSKYNDAVAEKVVEIVTNTKRFIVVDRTSYDKVKQELELQKTEAFIDSKNTVKQDVALAAQHIIVGHIVKMNVFAMKNSDGSINGYKCSVGFTIKVNDVETGKITEAESFQTNVSPLMLSPESAVHEALKSVEPKLSDYFLRTFPLTTKIVRVLSTKKEGASSVLVLGGCSFGLKVGNRLIVEKTELLEGRPYSSQIGEIKVVKVSGDDFSECAVLEGGKEILSVFNASEKVSCKLVVN